MIKILFVCHGKTQKRSEDKIYVEIRYDFMGFGRNAAEL